MTGTAKRKGDHAEREAAAIIHELTGWNTRRQLGAGRHDDTGDLTGVPNTTIQVANWADVARAAREKPTTAEQQRHNGGTLFACTWVRFRGGTWRVILTPDQWATYARNSQ